MIHSYPRYRDSGVAWMDGIPEHWGTKRLKFVASMNDDTLSDGENPLRPMVYVDIGSVDAVEGITQVEEIIFEDAPSRARRLVREGDTIISTVRTYLRAIAPIREPQPEMVVSTGFAVVRPRAIEPSFVAWALSESGFIDQIVARSSGVSYPAINASEIAALPVPLPPLPEQCSIAAFLDHRTAEIDALVARKRLLIERLSEYRTALITRTVTRGLPPAEAEAAGLDPNPPMHDSGVEWLGEVPEHWEVVRNRWLFRERDERSDEGEGELLTVSHITGVTRRSEKPDVGMFLAESLEGYKCCRPGDLIINTMWAWMGAAGVAKEDGLVSPSYNVYVPDNLRLIPAFADMAYRSSRYVLGMTSESRGIWNSRLRLYPQQFLSLVTAVPPVREQEAIVSHVNSIEEQAARMTTSVGAAIGFLQEYRTALVTAAVTGKIDVRDAAPAEMEGCVA